MTCAYELSRVFAVPLARCSKGMTSTKPTQVLIVGAGPTGLVLALWLTRLGIRVRIVDKLRQPATTSRALAVQARTLEFYRQIGLADAVVAARPRSAGRQPLGDGRAGRARVFGEIGAGLSPYPVCVRSFRRTNTSDC